MPSRTAPKRRAEPASRRSRPTRSHRGSSPRRGIRAAPRGARAATVPRSLPRPPLKLAGGLVALALAATGAVYASTTTPAADRPGQYDVIAQTGGSVITGRSGNDPRNFDVSRDLDRDALRKQAERQAEQRMQALAELAAKTQERTRELRQQWIVPLTGYRLTATFGQVSSYWASSHTGLDFAAAYDTPLVAVTGGTITETGYEGAYGNRTVLTLDDGTEVWYCHQSRLAASVGQVVAPGEVIGYVGETGNATGPHLHLEIRPFGGDPVDPFAALSEHNVTL